MKGNWGKSKITAAIDATLTEGELDRYYELFHQLMKISDGIQFSQFVSNNFISKASQALSN